MKRNKDSSRKKSYKALQKLIQNLDGQEMGTDGLREDNSGLHKVEEEWNKGSKEDTTSIRSCVGK